MSRLPCKNIDVMSSICNLTKKFCINCAGYEAREIPKEVIMDNSELTTTDKKAVIFTKGKK